MKLSKRTGTVVIPALGLQPGFHAALVTLFSHSSGRPPEEDGYVGGVAIKQALTMSSPLRGILQISPQMLRSQAVLQSPLLGLCALGAWAHPRPPETAAARVGMTCTHVQTTEALNSPWHVQLASHEQIVAERDTANERCQKARGAGSSHLP